ncbi:MAG: hypothetical protein LBR56_05430 [Sporomusaceae bacterium]|jgi:hypothetical protein|nr:hypothetical protein [Sporomusaceae bacterium]
MFKMKNKSFLAFLATLIFLLTPAFSLAAEEAAPTPFIVEDIGIMTISGKWKAVSAEEVLTAMDKMIAANPVVKKQVDSSTQALDPAAAAATAATAATPTQPPYDFTKAKDTLIQQLKDNNIKIYQVAVDSNNTYYTTYLIFYKEDKPISPNELALFGKNTSKADRQTFTDQLKEFQSFITSMTQSIPENYKSYINAEVLPVAPPESLTVKGLPAYAFETRIALNFLGLTAPSYAKIYLLNLDGYKTYAAISCADSERHFWNKTFKSMLTSLK